MERILPHFQRDNPQLTIETVVQRGKHPGLLGEYREPPLRPSAADAVLADGALDYCCCHRPLCLREQLHAVAGAAAAAA